LLATQAVTVGQETDVSDEKPRDTGTFREVHLLPPSALLMMAAPDAD
jgi:hypothetical protein